MTSFFKVIIYNMTTFIRLKLSLVAKKIQYFLILNLFYQKNTENMPLNQKRII